jgi:hypothetical protein
LKVNGENKGCIPDLTDDGGDVGTCTCTAGDAGHGVEGSEHNLDKAFSAYNRNNEGKDQR